MCECGCGAVNADAKLVGPDGKWYLLAVYGGCRDCGTPAGVMIDLVSHEEADTRGALSATTLCDSECAASGIPVLDAGILEKLVFERLDECGVCVGEDEEDRAACVEDMNLHELVRSAVSDTKSFPPADAGEWEG